MITGKVNGRYEPVIQVSVLDGQRQPQQVEAILDTGFTGSLTLPNSLISSLGLPWRSRSSAAVASGSTQQFDVYTATVIWDGLPRQILVQAIDDVPLLGMKLLAGYDLRIRVSIGGAVEIEAIP